MDTQYVLSIDPGLSTGIALLSYGDHPAQLVEGWQFSGGVMGLKGWLNDHYREGWSDSESGDYYAPTIRPYLSRYDSLYLADQGDEYVYDQETDTLHDFVLRNKKNVTVIAEKFTARNTKGFSYTTASLEPLRGEGALIALDLMPDYTVSEKRWRDPGLQYLAGGKDLADKKKRQHAFLKDAGFYRTNKDFPDSPTKDGADDFRSACAHGIAYIVKELKHRLTFEMLTDWSNG